jgi:dihydroxyacid dehydratase/phosphogluconate dehydratase
VREGDEITVDVDARRLDSLEAEEIDRRAAGYTAPGARNGAVTR